MALKERNMGKFGNKYCNVTQNLITLEELGFTEDGFYRWNYIIHQHGSFVKSLLASGDYLYLRDQNGDKYTDVELCVLWNRDISGPIDKQTIQAFINLLTRGNVRKEKTS